MAAFVEERAALGLPVAALVSRAGLAPDAAQATIARLEIGGRARRIGDLLVSAAVVEDRSRQLIAALEAHHASQPLSEGPQGREHRRHPACSPHR